MLFRIHALRFVAATTLAAALFAASAARAQQPPAGAIGRIDGLDVSVDGGTPAVSPGAPTTPSIYVASGSVVTVHSGKAQLTLAAGGQLDICGPARFTLLQSGDAVTLALSFGRMHVQLPAATALHIFTPTIIATPLDINGGARDVTVGLDVHDALCVLASSGALRLEHQFSGENLVVPQAGEFFLTGGKLAPVAGGPGTCECAGPDDKRLSASGPPSALPAPAANTVSLPPVADAKPAAQPSAVANKRAPASAPAPSSDLSVEFSVPAHANESHPSVPAPKSTQLAPPPEYRPEYEAMMPPLTFSAKSPAPPPEPSLDTILLVRIARVQPVFEFTGRVEPPPSPGSKNPNAAKAAASAAAPSAPGRTANAALPAGSAAPSANSPAGVGTSKQPAVAASQPAPANKQFAQSATAQPQPATPPAANLPAVAGAKPPKDKKSGGFWAKLRHIFGGSTVEAAPKPCQGTGCP